MYYPHYGNQGGSPYAAVRDGEFKLIRLFEDNQYELYHLSDDVGECHNIAQENPAMLQRLKILLNSWLIQTNAYIPTINERWEEVIEE